MKLNTQAKSDAIVTGDVRSNKVQIDTANIDFITQILSSNLYSNPLDSFLREILSNAVDSHIEAGTKAPVILDIGRNNGKPYIRIQDFGTGISKERFDKIYRFIGSSTKRDSNDYIGAFGLGRFSAMSVASAVNITSRYDGIETKYLMYKDGLTIRIDEVYSEKTTERNGVEVYVEIPSLVNYEVEKAIKNLILFKNVYINTSIESLRDVASAFNDKKSIYVGKSMSVICDSNFCPSYGNKISIGGVMYPIDTYKIKTNLKSYIIPHVDIGQVTVTPNREQLLYDTNTVNVINNAIIKAKEEFNELIKSKVPTCIDDTNVIRFVNELITYSHTAEIINGYRVSIDDAQYYDFIKHCKIFGKEIKNIESLRRNLRNVPIVDFDCKILTDGTISKSKHGHSDEFTLYDVLKSIENSKPILRNYDLFSKFIKVYIHENYSSAIIFKRKSDTEILSTINKFLDGAGDESENTIAIIDSILDSFDVVSSADISEQFKESHKETKLSVAKNSVWYKEMDSIGYGCRNRFECDFDSLDNLGKLIVWAKEYEKDFLMDFSKIRTDFYTKKEVVFVIPTKAHESDISSLSNSVHVMDFYQKNSSIAKKLKSYSNIRKNKPKFNLTSYIFDVYTYLFSDGFEDYRKIVCNANNVGNIGKLMTQVVQDSDCDPTIEWVPTNKDKELAGLLEFVYNNHTGTEVAKYILFNKGFIKESSLADDIETAINLYKND